MSVTAARHARGHWPGASDVHAAEITTLGRGGSDTTAVALAAQLKADRCQIFTDVKGIYTADPRIEPDARQLPVIGYEEMMELAHQGAQVMQTRAVELGWVNDVVIEVLSSFEDAPGTQIREDPLVEQRNKVRGLAHDRNVAKITLVEVPDKPGVARSVFGPLADAGINVDMIVQNVGHGGATDLSFTIPRVELAKAKRILEPLVRDLGFRDVTTDSSVAKVSIVGAGHPERPRLRRPDVRHPGRRRDQHRDDLHLRDPDHDDHRRGPGRGRRARPPRRLRSSSSPRPSRRPAPPRADRRVTEADPRRRELRPHRAVRERRVHQRHRPRLARGRRRRRSAPPSPRSRPPAAGDSGGPGPLRRAPRCSCRSASGRRGCRRIASGACPRPSRWRCATRPRMSPGCRVGAIRLKWPNDLVIEIGGPNALLIGVTDAPTAAARLAAPLELRKLAGVLGESDGLGTDDPRVVVGIGDQRRLGGGRLPAGARGTMTSLREASAGRPIDRTRCSRRSRVTWRRGSRRSAPGTSTSTAWAGRQATTGRLVTLEEARPGRARPGRSRGRQPVLGPGRGRSERRARRRGRRRPVGRAPGPRRRCACVERLVPPDVGLAAGPPLAGTV